MTPVQSVKRERFAAKTCAPTWTAPTCGAPVAGRSRTNTMRPRDAAQPPRINRMSSIVVIHGPQGCGKTRNAQALAAHSGYSRIVDDWDGRSKIEDGCLVLINSIPFGFKVPPLPVGFRGAALVDEASAHHGLHRVRSSMVAGGATFGEKEFQRGAVCFRWGAAGRSESRAEQPSRAVLRLLYRPQTKQPCGFQRFE